jgi:hypothetical protein
MSEGKSKALNEEEAEFHDAEKELGTRLRISGQCFGARL